MGGGRLCPVFYSTESMRTKTEHKLTVHLDDTDVSVVQMGSLLSITDGNGDTLHIFLGAQGWEALRESLNQRYSLAADS
tara:strand:+ start:203 stop:439 length:237 start_codon:yes stop_codon:yes gene_type:complete